MRLLKGKIKGLWVISGREGGGGKKKSGQEKKNKKIFKGVVKITLSVNQDSIEKGEKKNKYKKKNEK